MIHKPPSVQHMNNPFFAIPQVFVRKILVSRNSCPQFWGPKMAVPIFWAPGKMCSFCRKTLPAKFLVLGGGGIWVFFFLGGGGSADFIFMGARIFLIFTVSKCINELGLLLGSRVAGSGTSAPLDHHHNLFPYTPRRHVAYYITTSHLAFPRNAGGPPRC